MIERFILNIFILLFLHALADFTFQTEIMAKLKSRGIDIKRKKKWIENPKSIPIPEGQEYMLTWYYWLTAHALIQGGLIGFMFGNWYIAIIEYNHPFQFFLPYAPSVISNSSFSNLSHLDQ